MSSAIEQYQSDWDHGDTSSEPEQVGQSEHLYPTTDKCNELSRIAVSNQIPELSNITQGERVEQFKSWLTDKEQSSQGPPNHAYSTAHADYQCARILDVDRLVQWRYKNPHTIMITGGGGCFEDSKSTPILDYHDRIHSTHSTVMKQIRRAVGDRDYTYIKLYTPSKERNYGQTHWHLLIWVDGSMKAEDFRPALDSYVRNCSVAKPEYHSVEQAISARKLDYDELKEYPGDKGKGPATPASRYMVGNLVSLNDEGVDVRQSDFAELLWSAQMNAGNRSKVYTSRNFAEMAQELYEQRADGF
ncbi:hypothetical protein [Halococcus agarilyticus]|uniref:hypothetical protein n=1 Tax=Halococcus agarilyticus TaxID=1232219 RepID=UPI0012ABA6E2|nr:hypothetical protein [Halococcus agarilyticus]